MKDTTVKALIEELQKLPQDALVFACVAVRYRDSFRNILKPAHAHQHISGDVHVLGRINETKE